MELLAKVVPDEDVANCSFGLSRPSFCEHVRLLMLCTSEVSKAPSLLDEHEHAHWPEAARSPGSEEYVGARPTVKTYAEGIWS